VEARESSGSARFEGSRCQQSSPHIRDYDQIRRATLSVAANIVEGYALGTTALYRKHLRIAFGSAAEAEYLLKVAGELGYVDGDVVREGESLLGGAMRAIYGLMRKPPRRFEERNSHIPHPTSHAV
jgi:four helix bundle protein